jgi:hypothetical protein
MDETIAGLLRQLQELEEQIEHRFEERKAELAYTVAGRRVEFEQAVLAEHRRIKQGLVEYLRSSPWPTLLTAPFIYGMIVPVAFMDLRHKLAYLNGIEKLNCVYCEYANGVIAFTREVASRTEQYWCPIRHATRPLGAHERVREYLDYGDAEGWRTKLAEILAKIR